MEVMEGRLWLGREEGEVVRVAPHSITLGVTPREKVLTKEAL